MAITGRLKAGRWGEVAANLSPDESASPSPCVGMTCCISLGDSQPSGMIIIWEMTVAKTSILGEQTVLQRIPRLRRYARMLAVGRTSAPRLDAEDGNGLPTVHQRLWSVFLHGGLELDVWHVLRNLCCWNSGRRGGDQPSIGCRQEAHAHHKSVGLYFRASNFIISANTT